MIDDETDTRSSCKEKTSGRESRLDFALTSLNNLTCRRRDGRLYRKHKQVPSRQRGYQNRSTRTMHRFARLHHRSCLQFSVLLATTINRKLYSPPKATSTDMTTRSQRSNGRSANWRHAARQRPARHAKRAPPIYSSEPKVGVNIRDSNAIGTPPSSSHPPSNQASSCSAALVVSTRTRTSNPAGTQATPNWKSVLGTKGPQHEKASSKRYPTARNSVVDRVHRRVPKSVVGEKGCCPIPRVDLSGLCKTLFVVVAVPLRGRNAHRTRNVRQYKTEGVDLPKTILALPKSGVWFSIQGVDLPHKFKQPRI